MYVLWCRNPLWKLPEVLPTTLDEAVDRLLHELDRQSLAELGQLNAADLGRYEDGYRAYCKKVLGLDGRNPELLKNSNCLNAENATHMIFVKAWTKARKRAGTDREPSRDNQRP